MEAEGGELTEYERLRQRIQERNAAKLRQLGVTASAEDLSSAIAAKKRAAPHRTKPHPAEPQQPLRRSLRNRGMAPESNPAGSAGAGGSVGGGGTVSSSAGAAIVEEVPLDGHVGARSLNREAEEDEALMRVLRARMVARGFALETEGKDRDEGEEEEDEEGKREGDGGAQLGSGEEKGGRRGKGGEAVKEEGQEVGGGVGRVLRLPLPGKRVKGRGRAGVKEEEGEGEGGLQSVKGGAVEEGLREQGREELEAGRLRLVEGDVGKLTKERIHNVTVLPFLDRLVVVAGDKMGQVGVWDLGHMGAHGCSAAAAGGSGSADGGEDADGEGGASEGATGIFTFRPHRNPVSGLAYCPLSLSNVYTASYDGTIRCLDVTRASFLLLHSSSQFTFSTLTPSPPSSPFSPLLLLGTDSGHLVAFDPRASHGGPVGSWEVHDKKVSTVSFCPGQEEIIATASTDRTVRLWDVRKMVGGGGGGGGGGERRGKRRKTGGEGQGVGGGGSAFHAAHSSSHASPLLELPHARGVNSAYFSPDGAFLASTSYDDTIRLWSREQWSQSVSASSNTTPAHPKPYMSKRHNNQTGRWVSSFRAVWASDSQHVVVAGMGRTFDILSAASGAWLPPLASVELMTSIPARLAMHPSLPVIAGGSASGRVFVWRPAAAAAGGGDDTDDADGGDAADGA
ncbi:hypothetical protein CLOM_g5498 [Closterium sp. NIES-68]|nr:hypothetical protein CLOM_g5498 [Closterium sp. NIES-68]